MPLGIYSLRESDSAVVFSYPGCQKCNGCIWTTEEHGPLDAWGHLALLWLSPKAWVGVLPGVTGG